jgi:predicted GIY-YIG superfamily endonuclease
LLYNNNMPIPWFVYIARCADNSLYTGIALNPEARMKAHNLGRGAKYTASRLPIKMVRLEKMKNKSSALKRELEIKKWPKAKKEKLLIK